MIENKYRQCQRAVLIGLITTEQGKINLKNIWMNLTYWHKRQR